MLNQLCFVFPNKNIISIFQILALAFFVSISFFSQAQYGTGNPEKIKQLANRTLIVVKEEESQRIINILKTKRRLDQVETYKKRVAAYNADMEQVVEKFWKFGTCVEYKTFAEVERLYKTKSYAVLYCATVENFKQKGTSGGKMHQGLAWSYQDVNIKRDYWDKYTLMQIKLIEEWKQSESIYSQNLANLFPEKSDLVFGLQALNYYVTDAGRAGKEFQLKKVMQVTGEELASKTLLIKKDWVYHALTEKEIKSVYPYSFQITDGRSFNEMVLEADSSHAYLQIVPQVSSSKNKIKIQYLHLIIDAKDGKILGLSSPGLTDGDKVITKANLKDYSQYIKK
jgi:hypothetical protein